MKNTTFFKFLSLVVLVVVFVSCDKDYNTIGSDIVGNGNFNFTHNVYGVKAYNQKIPAIQTNNLAINQLGIYTDAAVGDVFGKTRANFVTQLIMVTPQPTFTTHIAIDSVVLTVPYFSTLKSTDASGRGDYRLDSIHSSNPSSTWLNPVYDPIDLKIYPNGFSLGDLDPANNLSTPQKFYSDEDPTFDNKKEPFVLNNRVYDPAHPEIRNENSAFIPDTREYKKYKVTNRVTSTTDVESRSSPRMRVHLDTTYFKSKIILAPASDLNNNNAFKTYFKGLYFQVQDAASGTLMQLNFAKGDVTIYYRQDLVNTTGPNPSPDRESKTFVMNMTGNTVNLLNNSDPVNPAYTNAMQTTNNYLTHANKLYLKGGQGAMAYVELFTDANEIQTLKDQNILVNDATLTFTVDAANITNGKFKKPKRIYVFDADTYNPILDYFYDKSTAADIKLNKNVYGGIQQVNTINGQTTITYKVRLTQLVNKILKEADGETKENIRLGVVVCEDINTFSNAVLKGNPIPAPGNTKDIHGNDKTLDRLPVSSVMNPFGLVFYGSDLSLPDDQRLKFEIYYTKPN